MNNQNISPDPTLYRIFDVNKDAITSCVFNKNLDMYIMKNNTY